MKSDEERPWRLTLTMVPCDVCGSGIVTYQYKQTKVVRCGEHAPAAAKV